MKSEEVKRMEERLAAVSGALLYLLNSGVVKREGKGRAAVYRRAESVASRYQKFRVEIKAPAAAEEDAA